MDHCHLYLCCYVTKSLKKALHFLTFEDSPDRWRCTMTDKKFYYLTIRGLTRRLAQHALNLVKFALQNSDLNIVVRWVLMTQNRSKAVFHAKLPSLLRFPASNRTTWSPKLLQSSIFVRHTLLLIRSYCWPRPVRSHFVRV